MNELKNLILNFSDNPSHGYFSGLKIAEDFTLPDNILIFMHDHFTKPHPITMRYMLIIPAVPLGYVIDNEISFTINPGQALLSFPCQNRRLQMTYEDSFHGYPRLMITFELSGDCNYLPDNMLLSITPMAEKRLRELIDAYSRRLNTDTAIMLYLLLKELSSGETIAQPIRYSDEVSAALKYIISNQGTTITLENLAHAARCSSSNLRLLFKKEIGMSPGAYIINFKLKLAENCLLRSSMKIEEIAETCGFQSIYAFSHFFKKKKGMSPLAWKALHIK